MNELSNVYRTHVEIEWHLEWNDNFERRAVFDATRLRVEDVCQAHGGELWVLEDVMVEHVFPNRDSAEKAAENLRSLDYLKLVRVGVSELNPVETTTFLEKAERLQKT